MFYRLCLLCGNGSTGGEHCRIHGPFIVEKDASDFVDIFLSDGLSAGEVSAFSAYWALAPKNFLG